jgi:hypothetical protein
MSNELSIIGNEAKALMIAAQEEGANEIGKLIKFSKGKYFVGTEEVPSGTEFIAHVSNWTRGWVKFVGGSLVEHRIGKVVDRFQVPDRSELGDLDPEAWGKNAKGEPQDVWCQQSYLPMENVQTGDVVTFVSGSVGGRAAISKLCGYAAKYIDTMGQPRIKLAVESYKHKSYGRIEKPDFPVSGWSDDGGIPSASEPEHSTAEISMDEIEFSN